MCDGLRMCVDVACVRASEVCWFGFEGGLLGAVVLCQDLVQVKMRFSSS